MTSDAERIAARVASPWMRLAADAVAEIRRIADALERIAPPPPTEK